MSEMAWHPIACIFPMLADDELRQLADDILENGQRVPITYWGGKLLDGRNRYRACKELKIAPEEEELDEELVPDPVAWVLSTNLHRRHLSETQRESVAAKLSNMSEGRPPKETMQSCRVSTEEAAEQLNVKPRNVGNAKAAIKGGCKELCEAMERSEITSSLAAKFVKAVPDKRKQKAILKDGIKAVRQAVKDFEDEKRLNSQTSTVVDDCDEYEDVDDGEPNRIGEIVDRILAEFEPYECMAIAEALLTRAKQ